jgi:hypothetical protein
VGSVKPCKGFASLFSLIHVRDVPEDAAAENFAHQRASHRAPRNRMEAPPHASTAQQIQRVVGQVGPRHAPHAFRDAAMCARVDYARRARARYGRFYNSHGSIIPDRSVLSKSHSPQLMASGGCWHRPRRFCVIRPGVRQCKFNSKWARAASRRRKSDFADNRKFGPRAVLFLRPRGIQLRPATVICVCRGARTSRTAKTCAGALCRAGISPTR